MNREDQNVWRDFDYVSKDFPHSFIRVKLTSGDESFFSRRTVIIHSLADFMSMIRADSPAVKDGLGWTIKVKLEAWQL